MRRYETIIITDPDLSEEGRAPVLDRVKELIPQYEGTLILIDEWGAKRLAYEIKKKTRGHYVRVDYCGNGALVDEIERFFRIDDRVLKFMTVLLDKDVDPEKILADLAQEKAAKEERESVEAATAADAPENTAEAAPETTAPAADTPEPEKTAEPEETDSREEA